MQELRRKGVVAVGPGHPRVRQYLKVKQNRLSDRELLVLEGLWAVREALRARARLEAVFVCPSLLRADESRDFIDTLATCGAPMLEVSERVLRRLVDREGPDGFAALARVRSSALDDIDVTDTTRLVVADGFELAGNLGTIIRCADGAGAAGVLVTERRLRIAHPLVVKASMGTYFSLPVVDTPRQLARDWLRRHGFRVVAADPMARHSYREADYSGPVAVVLGSERHGLCEFWKEAADQVVSIPMFGVADSLNVGHAAALLLYEALHWHIGR